MAKKRREKRRAKRGGKKVKHKTPVGGKAKRKVKKARKKSRAEKNSRSAVAIAEMATHGIDAGIAGLGAFDVEKGLASMPYGDAFAFAENYKAGSLYLHEQMAASAQDILSGKWPPTWKGGVVELATEPPVAGDASSFLAAAFKTRIELGQSVADKYFCNDQSSLALLRPPGTSLYLGSGVADTDFLKNVGSYVATPEAGAFHACAELGFGGGNDAPDLKLGQALFRDRASYRVAGIDDFRASLAAEPTFVNSPALDLIKDANMTVAGIIQDSVSIDGIMPATGLQDSWVTKLGLGEEGARFVGRECERLFAAPTYHSHLARVSELTVFAQQSVASFKYGKLGAALGLDASACEGLAIGFVDQSRAYGTFLKSVAESPAKLFSLTPETAVLPSLSFDSAAAFMESISVPGGSLRADDWMSRSRDEAATEARDAVEMALATLDPYLLKRLRGARQNLSSSNPERAVYYCLSMRELFRELLKMRAPDNSIKEWTSESRLYQENGTPTRRARVLYVCRELGNAAFAEYTDADIGEAIQAINQLAGKPHRRLGYSQTQLRSLSARMESALRLVLWDKTGSN